MNRNDFEIVEETIVGKPPRISYYIRYKGMKDTMFVAAGPAPDVPAFVPSPWQKLSFPSREAAETFLTGLLSKGQATSMETLDIPLEGSDRPTAIARIDELR